MYVTKVGVATPGTLGAVKHSTAVATATAVCSAMIE
jgi:hypothetical protein